VPLGTIKKFERTGQISLLSFIRLAVTLRDEAALEGLLKPLEFRTLEDVLERPKRQRGRLAYRDSVAYLEYDPAFVASGQELSPIHHRIHHSIGKPAAGLVQPHDVGCFGGLHGMFHDSLPDGWGRFLVDRRARQIGVEPAQLTPLDRLACVGGRGIGALSYAPALDFWGEGAQVLDLDQLASDSRLVLAGGIVDVLNELGRLGGSPGGARPKALIAANNDGQAIHGDVPLPQGYGEYLVKFPGADDPDDIARIERAYAVMAVQAGIDFPQAQLVAGKDKDVYFAVQRFDRQDNARVHTHTASGLLYTDIRLPSLDYQDLILLTRAVTRDQRQVKAMYRRAVFNVLTHNRDDHARQFSFIMTRDGGWSLAPAYDLTCAHGPGGKHSTSVLGHGKNITREHMPAPGQTADLKQQETCRIIEEVQSAIASWPTHAATYEVSAASKNVVAAALETASF
jgi:serine/threonine-protein kinase HipA